jgi:hypothetical protein
MTSIDEIKKLEEELRLAELGPNPDFFRKHLSDQMLADGVRAKEKIVTAHIPGGMHKFDKVEMSDFDFIDHGNAVIVTCTGNYEGPKWSGTMRFMRVWLKAASGWQVIAASTLK